jgi:hypothetical protein
MLQTSSTKNPPGFLGVCLSYDTYQRVCLKIVDCVPHKKLKIFVFSDFSVFHDFIFSHAKQSEKGRGIKKALMILCRSLD